MPVTGSVWLPIQHFASGTQDLAFKDDGVLAGCGGYVGRSCFLLGFGCLRYQAAFERDKAWPAWIGLQQWKASTLCAMSSFKVKRRGRPDTPMLHHRCLRSVGYNVACTSPGHPHSQASKSTGWWDTCQGQQGTGPVSEPQMPRMEALWFTDMKSKMLGMYKGKNEYWACEHIPNSTLKYMTLPLQRIFSSMNVPPCTSSVPKRSAKLCKCCHIPRIMFYLSSDPTFLDSNSMRRQISYVFLIYSCLCSLCLSLFFPSLSCSCICYSAWKTESIQVLITRLSDTPLKMSSPIFTLVYVAGFFSMYKTHHSCITRCCCFQ